jgi:hypothetical protein
MDVLSRFAYGSHVSKRTDFPDLRGFGTTEQFRSWGVGQGIALLVCFALLLGVFVAATVWMAVG